MQATIIAIAWTIAAGPGLVSTAPWTARAPAAAPSDEAAAAIARAKQAAAAGDYTLALREFESARALGPTPQLHFNVAVCHHALMLEHAADTPAWQSHRNGAIDSYRDYLAAAPNADDRADVERIIVELGGDPEVAPTATPVEPLPPLRDIVERIDPDPPTQPLPSITPAPSPPPKPVRTRSPARIGPFVPLSLAHFGRLRRTAAIESLPLLGLGLRGGAFLGPRARTNLGGEFSYALMPSASRSAHTLRQVAMVVATDWGAPVGKRRRIELAVGGIAGLGFESLHARGTSTLGCRAADNGRVATRGGLLLGARGGLLLLLGKRRNHELGLRVTPTLAVYGNGPRSGAVDSSACTDPVFVEAGLPGGAALVTTIDLGYAPRF
ncbi:MAG: hypothetical protein IPH07_07560 [Deltaproteobacteria bacterium]|nr:hypothetical protein [Deltaproteobacteria bacterium]MBK8236595.1 hypothetical protein [Deltaproteobacteria bacterium]MBK8717781.1 hypothetical protein [Deltaproteobacteria bacterium]MBP7288830.1 hypothetical protein [Nannocystaceae bacterium]